MVAHRSPKPLVWVRILLPLPKNRGLAIKNKKRFFITNLFIKINGVKMEKVIQIIKKVFTKQIILYGIFGVLTTVVKFVSYFILSRLGLEENLSNILAIILAVLFAYFTNRKMVFDSKAEGFYSNFKEFYKFILGRAFSMVVETLGFFLLFNILHIGEWVSQVAISIIVIILNFFISKFFVF